MQVFRSTMPCYFRYRSLPVDKGVLKLEHGNTDCIKQEVKRAWSSFPTAPHERSPAAFFMAHRQPRTLSALHCPSSLSSRNSLEGISFLILSSTLKSPPRPGSHKAGPYANSPEHLSARQRASCARATPIRAALALAEVPTRN